MTDFNAWLDSTDEEKKKKALQSPSQQAAADIKKTTQPTRTASGKVDFNSFLDTAPQKPSVVPTSKPTPQPTAAPQQGGFNLGGFLNNLGDTIKNAIVKAVPQLQPGNKPTIPTASAPTAASIQTPTQPLKQLDSAVPTSADPSATMTPTAQMSPSMQNFQKKTVNIVDSVLKTIQNPVDPATNTLLRAIPGVNSAMGAYKKGTEPLDILNTYNDTIKSKLKSVNPTLEAVYDTATFLIPGKFEYFMAKEIEAAPKILDEVWKNEKSTFVEKLQNSAGRVVVPILSYIYAPKAMEKIFPKTTLKELETILKMTYKDAPVLFNVLARAAGRGSQTMLIINAAQQMKAGMDKGATKEQIIQQIFDTTPAALAGGTIFGLTAEGWGIAQPKLFGYRKANEAVLTPEQARTQVEGTDMKGTPAGDIITKATLKAEAEGKNVKIEAITSKEGELSKKVGMKTATAIGEVIGVVPSPGGVTMRVTLVDAPAPIQQLKGEAPTVKTPTAPTTALSTTTAEPQTMLEITARYPIEKFSPSVISTGIQSGDKKFYLAEPTLIESLKPSDFNSPEMTKADMHLTAPGTSENLDGNMQRLLDQGYTFGGVMTKEQLPAPIQKEVQTQTVDTATKPASDTKPATIEPLKAEAIKFKTPEEFINSIGNTDTNLENIVQFHGTQQGDALKKAIAEGTVRVTEKGLMGKGFYVTTSMELGDYFGKQVSQTGGGGNRVNVLTKPEVLAIDLSGLKIKMQDFGKGEYYDFLDKNNLTPDTYNAQLQKEGYDGLDLLGRGETIIFDPKKVKTIDLKKFYSENKPATKTPVKVEPKKPITFRNTNEDVLLGILKKAVKSGNEKFITRMRSAVKPNTDEADTLLYMITKARDEVALENKVDERIAKKSSVKAPEGMASAGAETIGAFENRQPESEVEKHNLKIAEQVKELIKKYASTVGEGYTSKGASGTYFPKTQNIRINGMNDLSVASHEIAHYLDFAYDISKPFREVATRTKEEIDIKKELTDIYTKYYPGGKATHKLEKRSVEGFATLLQKYVEMPKQITEEYPNLVKEFLIEDGKYYRPVIGEILKDLEKFIEEYQALEPLDKIGTRVANDLLESDKKDFLNIFDKIRTFAEDEIYPTEKLDILAGTQWTGDSISLWLRAYSNGGGIYANNILNAKSGYWTLSRSGEFEKVYDYNWKNLLDHLKKEKIDDSFGNYLVARDQYFEWQELDNLLVEVNKAQTLVLDSTPEQLIAKNADGKTFGDLLKEAQDKYDAQKRYLDKNGFTRKEVEDAYVGNSDRFIDESKMYDELVREDLTLLNNPNIGLVTDEAYADMIKKEGYASMKRQMFDDILGNEGDKLVGAKSTKASSLKQRSGGQQQIINPVLNGMVNHIEIVKKAMRQAIYNKIGKIAASNKLPTLFQVQKLRVFPDDQGRLVFPQEKDPNIIMARIGGKRVPFIVDRTIKKTVESVLTYQAMNLFENLMVNVSRSFTLGTTGAYAPFALTNAIVDQWSGVMNTRNKYTPILDIVKIIGRKLAKSDPEVSQFYNEWQILGGDRMTLFQSQMQTMNEAVKYVTQETTKLEKVQLLIDKGIDILSLPAKYSETMSRFTEYYKARKAGKNQLVALEEAGRVTAPFHHIGSWKVGDMPSAKYMVRSIPFGNAAFQAMSQAFRTAETQEGRHRIMFLMAALVATYLTSLWSVSQLGSEDQKEQYKDLTPTDIATYLHFPAIGGNGLYRVKVSQELSTLGAIMTMVLSDNIMETKYTTEDYKDALTNWIPRQINIFSPIEMFFSWLPPAFKIPLELIANFKDYPRVKPLENQTMTNREPGQRFNEATSPLAKLVGEKFNISPIKTDFLIEGFFGRASRYITGKKGAYDMTSGGFREYFFSMGRRVQDFYDESTAINQKWNTLKTKYKGQTNLPESVTKEIGQTNQKRKMYDSINDMLGELRKIDLKKDKEKATWYRNKIVQGFEQLDKMK